MASQLKLQTQPCDPSASYSHVPPYLHVVSSHTSTAEPSRTTVAKHTASRSIHALTNLIQSMTKRTYWISGQKVNSKKEIVNRIKHS